MRIDDKEYEPCGHTSHWSCIPPRPARKDVIYEKGDLIRHPFYTGLLYGVLLGLSLSAIAWIILGH